MEINSPISAVGGIGPVYVKKLNKLGIKTVRDMLYHFPHRYEDFSHLAKIRDLAIGSGAATVRGKIIDIKNTRSWKKRMFITEALVEDDTAAVKAVWFNQPFLANILKKGMTVNLSGKVGSSGNSLFLASPVYEVLPESLVGADSSGKEDYRLKNYLKHTAGLIPVYPETRGLTSRALRFFIKPLLKLALQVPDVLPPPVKSGQKLLDLKTALWQIHFPRSVEAAKAAKRRLAFDEVFLWQLIGLTAKRKIKKEKATSVSVDVGLAKKFTASLPFSLTVSQRVSAWQILQDMAKPRPMNRLLQGDVGSGKTVVAALASLMAVNSGGQVTFMAPTEILARQHFQTLAKVFAPFEVDLGLLTAAEAKKIVFGKTLISSKQNLIKEVRSGLINIIIGTHSLIQKNVAFKNLVLAVIDEQHRFGVEQRAELAGKSRAAAGTTHLLSMTATPIPRTLALTIYGDLDISLIKELPPGRQKIITETVPPRRREETYDFIRRQVKEGRQVFVICPRIESSTDDRQPSTDIGSRLAVVGSRNHWADVKTVKEEYDKLRKKIFPELKIGMLHGRMPAKEKEKIMNGFSKNKTNILVSTSVVEVGIDVPNATIMMIEGAERFGLAQLHQLRGRVGRGTHQSYCFLFTDSAAGLIAKRLEAMQKCANGFELAEKDLEIRGPGDFYGIRQWGLPDLTMASLGDAVLIEAARTEAKKLLERDPELQNYPLLRKRIAEFKKVIHFE